MSNILSVLWAVFGQRLIMNSKVTDSQCKRIVFNHANIWTQYRQIVNSRLGRFRAAFIPTGNLSMLRVTHAWCAGGACFGGRAAQLPDGHCAAAGEPAAAQQPQQQYQCDDPGARQHIWYPWNSLSFSPDGNAWDDSRNTGVNHRKQH